MYPNSKELTERIDLLVAFRNGEEIEHRSIGKGTAPWIGKYGSSPQSLIFNFNNTEYRKKPRILEGYVHKRHVHPYTSGSSGCSANCIQMKEVTDDAS